jgi:hypothetical protein
LHSSPNEFAGQDRTGQEMSRHFRNKERKYLKDKVNELETSSKKAWIKFR